MSWHEVAAQVEEWNSGWRDEIATQRHADWADIYDDRPGREEWEGDDWPLRQTGPDPWPDVPKTWRRRCATTGLLCNRADPHGVGHTYTSSNGSEVPDKHTEGVDD